MSVNGVNLNSVVQQLQSTANTAGTKAAPATAPTPGEQGSTKVSFSDALMSAIDQVDDMKQSAAAQGKDFERGVPGVGLNDVMVDMQKAGLAFEMGVQVRNRVVNAYKEIMSMQV